jgi:hypothetical protein
MLGFRVLAEKLGEGEVLAVGGNCLIPELYRNCVASELKFAISSMMIPSVLRETVHEGDRRGVVS